MESLEEEEDKSVAMESLQEEEEDGNFERGRERVG